MTAAGHMAARRDDGTRDDDAAAAAHPFAGPGEMRARCRALDWATTPLGSVDGWPPALRTAMRLSLDSGFPSCVFAGPELVLVPNDAYAPAIGAVGHADMLGQPAGYAWPDVAQAYESGVPVWREDRPSGVERDGRVEEAFWSYALTPVRAESGAVVGVLGVFVETTDQVRARRVSQPLLVDGERARADAEAARERSDAVLASIADAFYLLDREWRFTYVNDAAEPLLQTTRAALLGRTLWEAFPGVAGSVFEGPYREAMGEGRVTSAEAYFAPLGTWFDVRTYPWAGGLMVHFRDIGARKAAEAERERLLAEAEAARRDAEAANRAKSEFLAVMSHELRTPLNAIGGYAELLELGLRGPVTDQQRADLARIQASQRHLLGLINQVLNYTRVDAGAVRYDITDVAVGEALAAAESLVLPQVRARGLTSVLGYCPPGLAVRADAEKLQQILLNLLSNAIKFTEPGGEVRVGCTEGDDVVAIAVSDTGVGIASEKLASIFEPFVQVDQRHTRPNEGVGLGLAISRDLARGMGGDLVAASEPGAGSTFTLVVPRGAVTASAASPPGDGAS